VSTAEWQSNLIAPFVLQLTLAADVVAKVASKVREWVIQHSNMLVSDTHGYNAWWDRANLDRRLLAAVKDCALFSIEEREIMPLRS
jgi:hypothetical protein